MKDFFGYQFYEKEVVIVGKGPTMDKAKDKRSGSIRVGLNHTINCDISHQIDWNSADYSHPFVLTPYYPLWKHRQGDSLAPDLDNVWCYNFFCAPKTIGFSPVIHNQGFSIHCVLRIFAMLGIKEFKFAGVDGGQYHHSHFAHLSPRNGGYDAQFSGIDAITREFDINITSL